MYSKMKVLLMDLDTNKRRRSFPNLALMKLSAFHKAKGDEVILNSPIEGYDIVYASCVFTWNKSRLKQVPPDAYIGGSGLLLNRTLPAKIECMMPDYDLYPGMDFSMGFTSRGCIRRCPWCKVPEMEGDIQPGASFKEFWDHRHSRILLLDNNLLASPNWRETLVELGDCTIRVDFNQGLDIRLLTDEVVWYLKRVKTVTLRFAFDDLGYEKAVHRGIKLLLDQGLNPRKLSFYVLVGYKGDQTWLERMEILASYGVNVYPMLYKGDNGKEPRLEIKKIPNIFWHGGRNNIRKFLRVAGRLP